MKFPGGVPPGSTSLGAAGPAGGVSVHATDWSRGRCTAWYRTAVSRRARCCSPDAPGSVRGARYLDDLCAERARVGTGSLR